MNNDNNNNNLNNDNHSISHILLTLCLILSLISLWFTVNTYATLNNYIDVQSGKINRTEVIYIDKE